MSGGSGLFGDWDRAIQILGNNPVKRAINLARNRIGVDGASMVREGIRDGAPGGKTFEPLSPGTTSRKGSTKPLIDHGDLLGSVTYELGGDSDVWIGARRGVRAKNGQDVADIAAVHEFGCTIAVTPTTHIHIPERSFLRATLESDEFQRDVVEKTKEELKRVLHIA